MHASGKLIAAATLAGLAVLLTFGCAGNDPDATQSCGNGVLDPGEDCESGVISKSCGDFGFARGTLLCNSRCSYETSLCTGQPTATTTHLRFFLTSDEHGWLEPVPDDGFTYGGMADFLARMRREGYDPADPATILLSSGDSWMGPAISTWFQGASTVEVMNAMGYRGATLGDHDFDFGQTVLAARAGEATYPLLAANLVHAATGAQPPYAQAFTLETVAGVEVGIVGLTLDSLLSANMPSRLEGLALRSYEAALRDAVPAARAAGAELIVVLAHACADPMLGLAPLASELGVLFISGGHCHQTSMDVRDGVLVVEPGGQVVEFARVDVAYDTAAEAIVDVDVAHFSNTWVGHGDSPLPPDPELEAIVGAWAARVDEELGAEVGYTPEPIADWTLFNLVMDAWLWQFPDADIAIANDGGFRGGIDAGPITLADFVSALPFENQIYAVEITGAQLRANLACCGASLVFGGMTLDARDGAFDIALLDGSTFAMDRTYRVLTSDYLYYGAVGVMFEAQDPDPDITGVHWRTPAIDWTTAQDTSSAQPLAGLDATPRNQR